MASRFPTASSGTRPGTVTPRRTAIQHGPWAAGGVGQRDSGPHPVGEARVADLVLGPDQRFWPPSTRVPGTLGQSRLRSGRRACAGYAPPHLSGTSEAARPPPRALVSEAPLPARPRLPGDDATLLRAGGRVESALNDYRGHSVPNGRTSIVWYRAIGCAAASLIAWCG